MNSVIELIHQRKSIRAFEDRPIPEPTRVAILDAALRSPTAGNMMLYSVIEVAEQSLKDRLVETCDHQPFIATAPWVLLFLADYQRWYDLFGFADVESECRQLGETMIKPQAGDLMLACCDTLIAAQTAVLAAESFGLGSCYIGDILENYETHREMFDLPEYVLPIALLCIGYPTSDQSKRQLTSRFGREFIVHKDRYQRLEESDVGDMFSADRSASEPNAVHPGLALYRRKFSAAYSTEMRRSVAAMLDSWERG